MDDAHCKHHFPFKWQMYGNKAAAVWTGDTGEEEVSESCWGLTEAVVHLRSG